MTTGPDVVANRVRCLGPLAGDTVRYMPTVVATALSGVLVLPFVTRVISPESFGHYSLIMGVATFIQVMCTTWISSTVVRYYAVAENRGDVPAMVATTLWITLGFSLITGALAAAGSLIFRDRFEAEVAHLLLLVPLLVIPFNAMAVPLQLLRVQRRIGAFNLVNIARLGIPPLAAGASAVLLGRDAFHWSFGWGVALLLIVPLAFLTTFRTGASLAPGRITRDWAKELIAYGAPLIPAMMLVKVLELSGRFVIGYFRNAVEVAQYTAAYTIGAMPMELIVLAVGSAAAPLLIAEWERRGREDSERLLAQISRGFLVLSIPAVVGLSLLAKPILTLFAPPEYVEGHRLVPLVALGSVFLALQWLAQRGMMLAGQTWRILACYTLATVVNLVANVFAVPRFGYIASGWTTVISYLVLLAVVAAGSRRHLTWRFPWATALRSASAAVVMAAAILATPATGAAASDVALDVVAGVAVYGVALHLAGERFNGNVLAAAKR